MLVSPKVESSLRIKSIFDAGELSASISNATRGLCSMQCPSVGQAPVQRVAAAQRLELRVAERHGLGQRPRLAPQRDALGVARQAVEIRAVVAGKRLELVERIGRFESLGVQLECRWRGVATGTAHRRLL